MNRYLSAALIIATFVAMLVMCLVTSWYAVQLFDVPLAFTVTFVFGIAYGVGAAGVVLAIIHHTEVT